MKTIIVKKNDSGKRIDNFLKKICPRVSTPQIYKFLRTKKIKVNSKKIEPNYKTKENDQIEIFLPDILLEKNQKKDFLFSVKNVDIVFEDDNILIANKPAGLVVHEDNDNSSDTLINRVKKYLFDLKKWDPDVENSFAPSLVNRIDRNTCGLVLVAKNSESLRILNEKIKQHEIDKYYLCLVHGVIESKSGILKDYLTKNENSKIVTVSKKPFDSNSKEIITKYKTIKHNGRMSLVEVELLTGRTHQIRSHLNFIGHPLIGEKKYTTKFFEKDDNFKYQMLCSYKIIFSFKNSSGILSYLNNKKFEISPPKNFNL